MNSLECRWIAQHENQNLNFFTINSLNPPIEQHPPPFLIPLKIPYANSNLPKKYNSSSFLKPVNQHNQIVQLNKHIIPTTAANSNNNNNNNSQ